MEYLPPKPDTHIFFTSHEQWARAWTFVLKIGIFFSIICIICNNATIGATRRCMIDDFDTTMIGYYACEAKVAHQNAWAAGITLKSMSELSWRNATILLGLEYCPRYVEILSTTIISVNQISLACMVHGSLFSTWPTARLLGSTIRPKR